MPQIGYTSEVLESHERAYAYGYWTGETNVQYAMVRQPAPTGSGEAIARAQEDANNISGATSTILNNIIIPYAGTSGGKQANSPIVPSAPVSGWTSIDSINPYMFSFNFPNWDAGIDGTMGNPSWLFLKSDQGTSSGYLMCDSLIKWIEHTSCHTNQINRVFGKNLYTHVSDLGVYLPRAFIILQGADTQNSANYIQLEIIFQGNGDEQYHFSDRRVYAQMFRVPQGTPNGNYNIYWYNRLANTSGVAGPFPMTVISEPSPTVYIRKASLEGAVTGSSAATSTADQPDQARAIQNCIITALGQTTAGGGSYDKAVVLLDSPGVYYIGSTLVIPPSVELRGMGKNNTILRYKDNATFSTTPNYTFSPPTAFTSLFSASQSYPSSPPQSCFIRMCEDSTISDLSIESTINDFKGTYDCIRSYKFLTQTTQNVKISRCSIRHLNIYARNSMVFVNQGHHDNLVFENNDVDTLLFIGLLNYVNSGVLRRSKFKDNYFTCSLGRSSYSMVGYVLGINTIFERNVIDSIQRGIFSTKNDGAKYWNYVCNNKHMHGGSEETGAESFDHEDYEDFYTGTIQNISSTTFTLPSAVTTGYWFQPITSTGGTSLVDQWVVIIDGKGFGQYRRIISNTSTSPIQITIDRPWALNPDTSSVVSIGAAFVENVIDAWSVYNTKGGVTLTKGINNAFLYFTSHNAMEGFTITGTSVPAAITTRTVPSVHQNIQTWGGCWHNRIFATKLINSSINIRGDREYDGINATSPALPAKHRLIVGNSIHSSVIINSPVVIIDKVSLGVGSILQFDNPAHATQLAVVKAFSECIAGVSVTSSIFDLFWYGASSGIQACARKLNYQPVSIWPHGIVGVYTNNLQSNYNDASVCGYLEPGVNPVQTIGKYIGLRK